VRRRENGTASDGHHPLAVERFHDLRTRGRFDEMEAAWKDAEEIAAIADEMFTDDVLDEFKRQYFERLAQAEE
jgi:hypothetical protein